MRSFAIIFFFVCLVVSAVPIQFPKRSFSGDSFNQMLCMVNQRRAQAGKGPMAFHSALNKAAQAQSDYQAGISSMTHNSPHGGLGQRDTAAGFPAISSAAENVAAGFNSINDVMNGWFNSAGHLANILSDNVYFGAGETNGYWTQEFASPLDGSIPSDIPVCPGSSDNQRVAHAAPEEQKEEPKQEELQQQEQKQEQQPEKEPVAPVTSAAPAPQPIATPSEEQPEKKQDNNEQAKPTPGSPVHVASPQQNDNNEQKPNVHIVYVTEVVTRFV